MIDLVVVGAGPAGLATSMYAAKAGLEVVVVENRPDPIDKACGEGLMPGAVQALGDLGVHLPGMPLRGIRYLDEHRSATACFAAGHGLGVRRTLLQGSMMRRARELGVRFEPAFVSNVLQERHFVTSGGQRSRYLAAADGLHSPIRRMLGMEIQSGGTPRWGLRQHFRIAPWTRMVEVYWAAHSEAYVTPVGPDEVGVAILCSDRKPLTDHLRDFPRLAERLVNAAPAGRVRGAGPLRQRTTARVNGRVLLVGDAAGYVDALTGEGIAVSLACARSLVDAIAQNRPSDYERAWRSDTRRYRWLTKTLLGTRRVAGSAIVPAASLLPDVFRSAVRQLAR